MTNFIDLTRQKMAAVVQIYVEGYFGEEVKSILNPRLGDLKEWTGSGFFIMCPYGKDIIITNAHVVRNAKTIEIMSMLTSEEKFHAELIGIVKNQEPDIAIIKLKDGEFEKFKRVAKTEIPHLKLLKEKEISRGTTLKAIGYPMGMSEPNITGGEITNFISGDRLTAEKYVTDAAINPGNSGGPAIDQNGDVIGINTSIYKGSDNIGFLTPSSFIRIILKNIFENNAICFAEIGCNFQKNSATISKHLNMSDTNGIIVSSLEKDGFIEKIGAKEEDIILGLNGELIDRHGIFLSGRHYHRRNILDIFKLIPIGKEVSLQIWRDGKAQTLTGQTLPFPKKRIESKPIINEREFLDLWGMTIQVLTYEIIEAFNLIDTQVFYQLLKSFDVDKERLVVTHIEKEGEAYLQEWSIGEVINKVNDIEIEGLNHLLNLIQEKHPSIKIKTELGSIGFFNGNVRSDDLELLNPTMFLK